MDNANRGKNMKDYKVFRDLTPEQDEAVRKWMKEGKKCFVCNAEKLERIMGRIKCNSCGLIVMDFDYEEKPKGVM